MYCCVNGCLHSNIIHKHLSFYKLPQHEGRRRIWLEAVGRSDLLAKENLKRFSYAVCSVHFKDSDFDIIRHLKKEAVPSKLLPNQSEDSTQAAESGTANSFEASTQTDPEPERPAVVSNILIEKASVASKEVQTTQDSSQEETQTLNLGDQTPRKRKLTDDLIISSKKCRKLENEIDKIRKELDAKNAPLTSVDTDDEIGKRFRKLIDWQNKLQNKFKGNRYDAEYKMFALNLHYSSPYAYRCLQTVLKLPGKRILNRLKMRIPPKLDDRVLGILELKIKHLPDIARHCTISVKEMTLKRSLYYNIKTDEIIGFQNAGGKITPEIASNAFVIMLQGMQYKWKQPIAYALLASAKHYADLDNWISEVISKLSGIGIKVHAVISEPASNFNKYAKDVKKVTVEEPYFFYNDNKVYYIFDVPHLVKCIRNNLLTSDFYYDSEKISWKYIRKLYKHQKNKNLRLIPKITEAHIDPNEFQKKRVKYATQIFSRTVAAALHTYIDLNILPEKARPTANFIETMNNLFDVLNSSKLKTNNKLQRPLIMSTHQEKILDDAKEMFKILKAINRETGKVDKSYMKSFVNFQISIEAVKMLYGDAKKEGFKYLLTRQLNQDCLETFFRSIGGFSSEPTPIQFSRAFSKLFIFNMLKRSPNANYELDIYDILREAEDVQNSTPTITSEPTSAVVLDGETDYRIDLPKENALTYVSSYLLYKCMNKHKCSRSEEVTKSVLDFGEESLFAKYEAYNKTSAFYGALKLPPKEFRLYIQNLESTFTHNFQKYIQVNPAKQLYELLTIISSDVPCPCFPAEYLLKLFVRMRIYALLRYNNRQFKVGKNTFKVNQLN